MIREIKYIFTESVNHLTCHALFATITDNALAKLKINAYSKPLEYKVSYQDRTITILINDEDFNVSKELVKEVKLKHRGREIIGVLFSDNKFTPSWSFKKGDFVRLQGVLSYAKKVKEGEKVIHQSPVTLKGNLFLENKEHTLKYLESKLGIDLSNQIDFRSLRFEFISYKSFEDGYDVYSKSNNQKISFHNVFSFDFDVYVVDEKIVNSLEYSSVGKKRSYGFGNVFVRAYKNNEEAI